MRPPNKVCTHSVGAHSVRPPVQVCDMSVGASVLTRPPFWFVARRLLVAACGRDGALRIRN